MLNSGKTRKEAQQGRAEEDGQHRHREGQTWKAMHRSRREAADLTGFYDLRGKWT